MLRKDSFYLYQKLKQFLCHLVNNQCIAYISLLIMKQNSKFRAESLLVVCYFIVVVNGQYSQQIKLNQLGLPVITLCDKFELLIDTGSQEIWIADRSCRNCPFTIPICPHLHEHTLRLEYFQGQVKGDATYLNSCLGSNKIMCVKEAKGMQKLGAMGILGTRGNSTGSMMLKNLFKRYDISIHSFSIYLGLNEAKIFFGQIPNKYIKQQIVLKKFDKWEIPVFEITFNDVQFLISSGKLTIDTGSNIIILPTQLYSKIQQQIKKLMKQKKCKHQNVLTFICSQKIVFQQQSISLKISQDDNTSRLHIQLQNIIQINDNNYIFKIQQTNTQLLMLGISIIKHYIVEFHMNGSLRIYSNNKQQLSPLQITNYRFLLCEYIAVLSLLSVIMHKVHQLAEGVINRKIVI